ncbi:hypothetical protein G647_06935 [Cladophialophora carrionii CBS 160.54]|uniref:N-acetyltransferase domain-containing protein n=1 Tax=Cladophialophora carrionii CBS 160.54 TaxID=1279043 RepID=V9D987_9EURO|nr:uncharacterized protein G647_06935 [Cladophialophora carrionii CBS 160.54]ETI22858.1 hypothetical protein G647_06935 [Cladophialophora carrionii CBS 160.54]
MSSLLATPAHTKVSPESQDEMSQFVSIITAAFSDTALTTAFIADIDSTPPPYPSPLIDPARRRRHFSQGILDSAAAGAELVQAGNWSAIALWEPPSFQGKTFIDSKARPPALLSEWRGRVKQAKAKYLAKPSPRTPSSTDEDSNSDSNSNASQPDPDSVQLRPFYHLSFLARNPSVGRVPGSINAVITPFLERAKAENVPAWLEATSLQAVNVYLHFGFRIVETITVGAGKVDAAGWPAEDGEGVTAWAMIFDEHLTG